VNTSNAGGQWQVVQLPLFSGSLGNTLTTLITVTVRPDYLKRFLALMLTGNLRQQTSQAKVPYSIKLENRGQTSHKKTAGFCRVFYLKVTLIHYWVFSSFCTKILAWINSEWGISNNSLILLITNESFMRKINIIRRLCHTHKPLKQQCFCSRGGISLMILVELI